MALPDRRIAFICLGLGSLCAAAFACAVVLYGRQLRADIRQRMIERDAAVLYPVAQRQVDLTASLSALLPDADRRGTLALAIFDAAGVTLDQVPASQTLVELPLEDYVRLQDGRPLTRYHPEFPLDRLAPGAATGRTSPVLEVILPILRPDPAGPARALGYVRYHLDARPLAAELAQLDENVRTKGRLTLALGIALIALLTVAALFALDRARRTVADRNDRLARTHSELSLASKASALGQITSHLLHDLRGPVAGLQAAAEGGDTPAVTAYTRRLQSILQEASELLADESARIAYELSGADLAVLVRRRHEATAAERGVRLAVQVAFAGTTDGHRGSILCLIVGNLVQNALTATPAGRAVAVDLRGDERQLVATVTDEGPGIPDAIRGHLFTPGRSGRADGTGLGLAISRLLARQIDADLELVRTGPDGTVFRVSLTLARQ